MRGADDTDCEECDGTGYWGGVMPSKDAVLDMMDCCGVCCGKGYLSPAELAEMQADYPGLAEPKGCADGE